MKDAQLGTLYGIGVGPGEPDLITLKAVKALGRVNVVFAAASTKNFQSLAVSIARPFIPEGTPVHLLKFPMTRDRTKTAEAWRRNALRIVAEIGRGQNVAFLTLGDCLTYSTYGYILRHIKSFYPSVPVTSIPGITSYHAAAARLNMPLVEGEESLAVVSGAQGGERLREFSRKPDTIVFLKAYRNVSDITSALQEADFYDTSVAVKYCGLPGEEIIVDVDDLSQGAPDYWTLIIAKSRKEAVMVEAQWVQENRTEEQSPASLGY